MRWPASYGLLVKWQARQLAPQLPLIVIVQALMAIGVVIGFGYLAPQADATTALFLTTGAPTIQLLTIGVVTVPQTVAQAKLMGTYDYVRALPVPRLALLLADLTVWLLATLPGLLLSLALAVLRYDVGLALRWEVVPVVLLVALTACAVGYTLAALLPPMVAMMISQVLVFVILLFAPVTFPADRLPAWLAAVHEVLPIAPLADLVRATLAADTFTLSLTAVLVTLAWCAAALTATAVALNRRT